jgi:hypothetical protein
MGAFVIRDGHVGGTRLDGVRFAHVVWWPGAVHQGKGANQLILDEGSTPEQRHALIQLNSGRIGGGFFEVFASTCTTFHQPIVGTIAIEIDRARRIAAVRIPGILENLFEPIRNPVTGAEHRARIVLPNGWEFREAEMANSKRFHVDIPGVITMDITDSYGQLNEFDWGP